MLAEQLIRKFNFRFLAKRLKLFDSIHRNYVSGFKNGAPAYVESVRLDADALQCVLAPKCRKRFELYAYKF